MIDETESVILVDGRNRRLGECSKIEAHRKGLRHRAFSVFVTRADGHILLQRRSMSKYHSGGLWTNACCGHPRIGEASLDAARRRLREEMRLDAELLHAGRLAYQARLADGWFENEIVDLYVGKVATDPDPDPEEAMDWLFVSAADLESEFDARPDAFTAWFGIYMERIAGIAKGRGQV
jgi:isopentenyl-diphosphate delta-isomerase